MLRRRLSWALGASLVAPSALCVARSRPATVPLASTVCQPLLPPPCSCRDCSSGDLVSRRSPCHAAPCCATPAHALRHALHTRAARTRPAEGGVLAELASRGYPALALDLRGHGEARSARPTTSARRRSRATCGMPWRRMACAGLRPGGAQRGARGHACGHPAGVAHRAPPRPPPPGRGGHRGHGPAREQTAEELSLAPTDAAGRRLSPRPNRPGPPSPA